MLVAVVADDFWSARQARDRLQIEWDESGALTKGSGEMMAELRGLLMWTREGDMAAGMYRPMFFHGLQGALRIARYQHPDTRQGWI